MLDKGHMPSWLNAVDLDFGFGSCMTLYTATNGNMVVHSTEGHAGHCPSIVVASHKKSHPQYHKAPLTLGLLVKSSLNHEDSNSGGPPTQ